MSCFLRKCNHCGLEAHSLEDLALFVPAKRHRFGRQNECRVCNKSRMKVWSKILNAKRIEFKGKNISFKENPRTNICSKCGRKYPDELKEQTCLHHLDYDPKNPLAHTIELCRGCHITLHKKGKPCKQRCNETEGNKR